MNSDGKANQNLFQTSKHLTREGLGKLENDASNQERAKALHAFKPLRSCYHS